jgi:UDP-glucuronate decarboxylase
VEKNAQVLFSSTSEVYGDPEISPQPESYKGSVNTVGPRACYDEGKRVAETLCYEYHRKYNTDIKIFRIFNAYGVFMDAHDGRVVTNFINQALHNQPLTIFGTGMQSRSFQYIDDLVEGIVRLSGLEGFQGPINLGNPYEFTMLELAQKVLQLIPESRSELVYMPLPQDDPTQRRPDISIAKELLGWEPVIQLEEGLLKTIEYFKAQQASKQS